MEAFIFIVIVALLAFVLPHKLVGRRRHSKRANTRRARQPEAGPRPFDPRNATPIAGATVLRGFAYVVDGDTLVINKIQIRLFGVDAPELDHPYGKKAKWALISMCKGTVVRAEVVERDTHGRTVAHCFLSDGRDISAEMVRIGLALDWPKYSGGKYRALEPPYARRRLWLADARQKGRMEVWEKFEAKRVARLDKG